MGKCDKERILKLREQGLTYQSIADVVGCSRQYVAQVCTKEKQTIKVRPSVVLPKTTMNINAEPLLVYLDTKIKILENTKHCYEVFDRRGGRYPLENIYKEIVELVHTMVEVTE